MKSIALLVPLCVVPCLGAVATADPQPAVGASATLDRVIAVVEHTAIWQSELDELLARAPAQSFDPDQKRQALESLIDNLLVQHTAEMRQLAISPAQVDDAIKEVEDQNHIDDAGLDRALADQHYTRSQYRDEIARQLRAELVVRTLIAPRISVTEAEVDAALAKNPSKTPPTDEQRDQVRQALWQQKVNKATEDWLVKRKAGAHIEVKL
jgi:peptidyl-prolyl cis-trans isomerase SurA